MKTWTVAAALLFVCTLSLGQTARKPCDELKTEITKKLDDKGVVGYTLEVVDKGKEAEAKVVGSCDGGTKSIVYTRGAASPEKTESANAKKPQ